ncbi:MFS transporter [Pyrinomonas sp.]|mgnify:CR=1 FL=1|uniref:MFS transporter n=1 Tax=Pyrinomonas sp. TaxID=2080306 RepID=UPI00332FAEEC
MISGERSFFRGWTIVAVSTLAMMISNGLSIGGIPVFYRPLLDDLISKGAVTAQLAPRVIGLAASLTFLAAGLFSPVAGILVARFKLRPLMCVGCFVLGTALLLYSQATVPAQVYAAHVMFGLSLGFVGLLINTVLISNWFRRRRGTAMGIVITGTSFGGVLIPAIATPLIALYGWRTAVLIVSLLVWMVLLPAILLFVRDHPQELGLLPDGDAHASEEAMRTEQLAGMTLNQALRTPIFWVFGACAALLFYPIFTTSQQFILYLQTPRIGLSREMASVAQATLFITSVGGKFFFGWLSDRMTPTRVMLVCCSLMFGATLLLLRPTPQTAFLFLIPFGLGYGGTFVLIQLLAVETFGLRDIGRILGTIIVIETIGGATGTYLTGRLASAAGGDYTPAFYGVIIAAGGALLMAYALYRLRAAMIKAPLAVAR